MTQPTDPSQNPENPGQFPPAPNYPMGGPQQNPGGAPQYPGDPSQQQGGQPPYPGGQPQYPGGQPQYQGGQPAGGQQGYGPQAMSESDERLWATLSHVGALFFSFVAPLIIWSVYKPRSKFVKDHSTESLNFSITLFIVSMVCGIGVTISSIIGVANFVGFIVAGAFGLALLAAEILAIVWIITGALRAHRGQAWQYPVSIRMVK